MRILAFDLHGPFAHFRKIYTNSSSLSYSIPPRTTLAGIIAAMIGRERDSYYSEFSRERSLIAVRKIIPTRKIVQTINYMRATGPRDLIMAKQHTQIPYELVCGEPEVRYRIYFANDTHIYEELKDRLIKNKYVFPPYLGAASFAAAVDFIGEVQAERFTANEFILLATPINISSMIAISFEELAADISLVKERMPVDFTPGRYPVDSTDYIYDERGQTLPVKVNGEYWHIEYAWQDQYIDENIVFY